MSAIRPDESPHHPRQYPSTARHLAAATGLVLGLLGTLLLPGTASAAPREDAPGTLPTPPPAPGQAWMGAGVQMHEGEQEAGVRGDVGTAATVEGVDVSSHQGNVDWGALYRSGVRWAYSKATEGTSYKNPYFAQQYNGSYRSGMIRGAYHFAVPSSSSGATQAKYFADNGGGWSKDGKTLPGVLDIEYNPYGSTCYGLSQSAMVSWIRDFTRTYKARTGRDAVIYTTTDWWTRCTGNNGGFGSTNPLWIARYASSPGTLPAGWGFHTFWQYTSKGPIVGDHNKFNGAYDRLKALANG
ncbi:lysozyme [Streptomyces sp. HNM0574]|uniref:lysozyme n=1 Tax=Streptomyces sp. HNM0574 TaxID=2714954 RepID=UPI00146E57EA|nr:lysozyme [Streptomyces sp. HNM0574]NLU67167.1 lysozyme [Streptomyces sp. HNM0574]